MAASGDAPARDRATKDALGAYQAAGMLRPHESQFAARDALIASWAEDRKLHPRASQLMLAYTREDVQSLNLAARERLQKQGELGPGQRVQTAKGDRSFAPGDRVMFLRNERSLGVRNGTIGAVDGMAAGALDVRLDDGRKVSVDLQSYNDLDYGYATTIHKAQGVTVDRVQVLASAHMDRQAAYVALSRHRDSVQLQYSQDTFPTHKDLVRGAQPRSGEGHGA